jgi:hypothetical protein
MRLARTQPLRFENYAVLVSDTLEEVFGRMTGLQRFWQKHEAGVRPDENPPAHPLAIRARMPRLCIQINPVAWKYDSPAAL